MPSTDINKKNFISYTYWCIFFALKIYWIEFIFTYEYCLVLWHRTDSNVIHNLGNIPFAKDELQRVASNAKEKNFLTYIFSSINARSLLLHDFKYSSFICTMHFRSTIEETNIDYSIILINDMYK